MGRARETTKRAGVVCRSCGAEYETEVVMKSRSVPGVMGPVGEILKSVREACPKCGSYNIALR